MLNSSSIKDSCNFVDTNTVGYFYPPQIGGKVVIEKP